MISDVKVPKIVGPDINILNIFSHQSQDHSINELLDLISSSNSVLSLIFTFVCTVASENENLYICQGDIVIFIHCLKTMINHTLSFHPPSIFFHCIDGIQEESSDPIHYNDYFPFISEKPELLYHPMHSFPFIHY